MKSQTIHASLVHASRLDTDSHKPKIYLSLSTPSLPQECRYKLFILSSPNSRPMQVTFRPSVRVCQWNGDDVEWVKAVESPGSVMKSP